jgi:hypothetical protein
MMTVVDGGINQARKEKNAEFSVRLGKYRVNGRGWQRQADVANLNFREMRLRWVEEDGYAPSQRLRSPKWVESQRLEAQKRLKVGKKPQFQQ